MKSRAFFSQEAGKAFLFKIFKQRLITIQQLILFLLALMENLPKDYQPAREFDGLIELTLSDPLLRTQYDCL